MITLDSRKGCTVPTVEILFSNESSNLVYVDTGEVSV